MLSSESRVMLWPKMVYMARQNVNSLMQQVKGEIYNYNLLTDLQE